MTNQKPDSRPLTANQLLDLLLDALLDRQAERQEVVPSPAQPTSKPSQPPRKRAQPEPPHRRTAAKSPAAARTPRPGEPGWEPPAKVPSVHLEKILARFLVLVAVLIVAVNVPVNRYGVSLARIMPDSAALVIRDGLVLKGSSPEIYMLQDDKLRWISSLDAFDHLGLKWGDVHVVEDAFLERFEQGRPIHVLLKCPDSPHIYRLENQQKRWIKDIDTFLAEGHQWEDVRFVPCSYLRDIPDGPPIPENAGLPPQP
jgi:hypothetical protein